MKYSGIGGQAVLEGVMMKNGSDYAVAVRKQDGQIEVVENKYQLQREDGFWRKFPIVRGVISFIDSLVLGISTLMVSSAFFAEEEDEAASENEGHAGADFEMSAKEKAIMSMTTVISFVIAVAVFVIVPYYLSQALIKVIDNQTLVTFIEGIFRLAIFIVYILLISRSKDIQRVFMYHGAEHKCINCIEHGLDLTVENVRGSSKEHKRCGTSFLMYVVLISIILFLFIRVDSHAARIAYRLLLVPVIAGVSYEILRVAGRADNRLVRILSRPGMAMQGLTTKEPDDSMIEVGIASVEAVFDWRSFVREMREEDEDDLETGSTSCCGGFEESRD